jgi:uncharacterized protein YcfJ
MERNHLQIAGIVAGVLVSTAGFAHGDRDDDYHYRHHYRSMAPYVVIQPVYAAPPVVYYEAPRRVVYREPAVVYPAAPAYYRTGPALNSGHVVGALAGGLVGASLVHGDSRPAAVLVGAVLGGAIGGNAYRDGDGWR